MNSLLEPYALEALIITDDPFIVALEVALESAELSNTTIGRKEKRLAHAVANGDQEAAQQIKSEIDETAEKLKKAAQREKNIKIAKAALQVAGVITSLAGIILSHSRDKATIAAMDEIAKSKDPAAQQAMATLLAAQNKDGQKMKNLGYASTAIGAIGSLIGI